MRPGRNSSPRRRPTAAANLHRQQQHQEAEEEEEDHQGHHPEAPRREGVEVRDDGPAAKCRTAPLPPPPTPPVLAGGAAKRITRDAGVLPRPPQTNRPRRYCCRCLPGVARLRETGVPPLTGSVKAEEEAAPEEVRPPVISTIHTIRRSRHMRRVTTWLRPITAAYRSARPGSSGRSTCDRSTGASTW